MKVRIRKVAEKKAEEVIIQCMEITPEVKSIYSYVLAKGKDLSGMANGRICQFPLEEVCYFEAVDNKVFAYTKNRICAPRRRANSLTGGKPVWKGLTNHR